MKITLQLRPSDPIKCDHALIKDSATTGIVR